MKDRTGSKPEEMRSRDSEFKTPLYVDSSQALLVVLGAWIEHASLIQLIHDVPMPPSAISEKIMKPRKAVSPGG